MVLDRTPPIRGSLHHVGLTLVISALLVILVVFMFLRRALNQSTRADLCEPIPAT